MPGYRICEEHASDSADAHRLQRSLQAAEAYARKRGARFAHLSTFSFQAPDFYVEHGYEAFGELAENAEGHKQVFLRKTLVPWVRASSP